MNKFQCKICITNPDTLHTQILEGTVFSERVNPDYRDIATDFFLAWDKKDKYDKGYIIGINSMNRI